MSQQTLDPFRLYADDQLGPDGYPPEWHKLPEPDYTAVLDEADLVLPSGIKHVARAFAHHRCVRCGHPYRVGSPKSPGGEWSPCDLDCLHLGPYRWRAEHDTDWVHVEHAEAELGRLIHAAWSHIVFEARWRILTVHHLDGNKANCRWWNLVALCQRCHLTIQGKVQMARVWPWEHSEWFRPYVAGYYASVYLGEELTRSEVDARVDELLDLERAA